MTQNRHFALRFWLTTSLILTACGGESTPPLAPPLPPSRLAFTTQAAASTGAGSTFSLSVAVQDSLGKTVTTATNSVSLTLTNNTNGAVLSGAVPVTAVNGIATFSGLGINVVGSGYTIVATAAGLADATTSAFAVVPGAVAKLVFTVQPASTPAGAAISPAPQVTLYDAFDNLATNATALVTVSSPTIVPLLTGSTGILPVNGVATFTDLQIQRAGASYVLNADTPGAARAVSSAFDIVPGPAMKLWFNGGPATVNETADPITGTQVFVTDNYLNTVTTATNTVTLSINSPSNGAVLSGTRIVNAVAGVASFDDLAIDRPETYTFVATSPSLSAGISHQPFMVQLHLDDITAGGSDPGGQHTCGIKAKYVNAQINQLTYCWGSDASGELGDGGSGQRTMPVPVAGGLSFTKISAGGNHTCALHSDGTAYCWGKNSSGQLGDGTAVDKNTPTAVSGGRAYVNISAGDRHTCATTVGGTAYCWGLNQNGQLGDGSTTTRLVPTAVSTAVALTNIRTGMNHTCAVVLAGPGYCWGLNVDGELGDGSTTQREFPTPVSGGKNFYSIETGVFHSCGFATDDKVYCWGGNGNSQLGNGTAGGQFTLTPTQITGGLLTYGVTAGAFHGCVKGYPAPNESIKAYCWGYNDEGQVGDATSGTSRNSPVLVQGVNNVALIDAATKHACALTEQGVAYCWGANANGQLGDGTTSPRTSAVKVGP